MVQVNTCLSVAYRHKLSVEFRHMWKCVRSLPFIHLFNHFYQCELMDIYFILGVIIQYYLIYFVAQIIPALSMKKVVGSTMDQEWPVNSVLFLVLSRCITCSFTYVFWYCVIWLITTLKISLWIIVLLNWIFSLNVT